MGSFVDKVPWSSGVSVSTPYDLIVQRIDEVSRYADDWAERMQDAVDNMQDAIGPGYMPSFSGVDRPDVNVQDVPFPVKPDLAVILNENWPDTNLGSPVLDPVNIDLGIANPPEAPEDVDADLNYTAQPYESCLRDEICRKIRDGLINGGTDLTDTVHALIIDRAREARRVAEDRAMQRAYDSVGVHGFDLPPSMAAAVVMEIQKETLAKDIDGVNAVAIKDFEVADANEKFIKDLAVKFEQIERQGWDSEQARLFEIARASKEFLLSAYEQRVKVFLAKWDAIRIELDAKKKQIDAVISKNDSKIKDFLGRAEILKSQVAAISEENKAKTDLAKAQAQIYSEEVGAVASVRDALVKEAGLLVDRYRADIDRVVQEEKVRVDAINSMASLSASVSEAIAKIATQAVASALGAINTHMSYRYNGAKSREYGFRYSLDNRLRESHDFKEE